MTNIMILFNSTVILSFGLGIFLSQILGDRLASGVWFMGFGFLFLIGYYIYEVLTSQEEKND